MKKALVQLSTEEKDVRAQLRAIQLFSKLDRRDLDAVAGLVRREQYPAGSLVCHQGEFGTTFYIVEAGQLRVLHVDPRGFEQEVACLRPGSFFGETSLLLGEPRDATVEVVQDATLLYLNKDEFDQLLQERPSVLKGLTMRSEVARKRRARRFRWQDPDEVTFEFSYKHRWVFIRTLSVPLVLALILASLRWLIPSLFTILLPFAAVLVLLTILWFYWDWRNDYFIVTNKRVAHEERVLFIREIREEAPLHTIRDIQEERMGVLARILGFGDLIIETLGGQVVFRYLPDPERMRDTIFEQMQRVQAWARAEQRATIRQELHHQFGLRPPPTEEKLVTPPPRKRGFPLQMPAPLRTLYYYLLPPTRIEEGDTITWRKNRWAMLRAVFLPGVLLILAFALALVVAYHKLGLGALDSSGFWLGYGVALVPLVLWLWWRFEDWRNDLYQVTATRIVDIERLPFLLREQRREAGLEAIQNISLEIPGFWAQVLRFGTVIIETAAGRFDFVQVHDPRAVQQEIFRRMEAFRARQQREEAERRHAELLDWFAIYDQIRHPAQRGGSPTQQTPEES